jgi:hypothetical protein
VEEEPFEDDNSSFFEAFEEPEADDFYGIENEYSRELREKIQKSKQQRGRGLLVSFFEFN